MGKQHIVRQGECISSIAFSYGFLPDTIWNDPANLELKNSRKEGNVLYEGDKLWIPDRREKHESRPTDAKHVFRRKGVPEVMRVVLLDPDDQPRVNLPYILTVGGQITQGTTDGNGLIVAKIPPDAKQARLLLGEDADEEITILLGNLNPVMEISGVQARLQNLGYECGPIDGILGPRTLAAIHRFQRKNDLPLNDEIDEATRKMLVNRHGS
jgi:hypothetical protein